MKKKKILFSSLIIILCFLSVSFTTCFEIREITGVNEIDYDDKVDGPPVSRSEVILTADAYARLHWTMTEQNRTGIHCNGNFISKYPVGDRIGMGYKWNGWNSIEEFIDKIAQGYGTGTGGYVNYENYSIDCVVGVSCTGFVSRAWHLDYKYTLNYTNYPDSIRKFCQITQPVDNIDFLTHKTNNLKKGDAFINDTHIILFVYETRDGQPMIMDSSYEGVQFRNISWDYLAYYGYQAIRYNNIKEVTNPTGTKNNPISIPTDNFPFTHQGNTRDVVSLEFDSYSMAPETNEQGPEYIYQLQVDSTKTIMIHITEVKNETIDNDIHLLTTLNTDASNKAVDCIARGDNSIEQILQPGIYYIIVDSNNDKPGEYTLTINF